MKDFLNQVRLREKEASWGEENWPKLVMILERCSSADSLVGETVTIVGVVNQSRVGVENQALNLGDLPELGPNFQRTFDLAETGIGPNGGSDLLVQLAQLAGIKQKIQRHNLFLHGHNYFLLATGPIKIAQSGAVSRTGELQGFFSVHNLRSFFEADALVAVIGGRVGTILKSGIHGHAYSSQSINDLLETLKVHHHPVRDLNS